MHVILIFYSVHRAKATAASDFPESSLDGNSVKYEHKL